MRKHSQRKQREWRDRIVEQRMDRSKYVAAPSASKEILKIYNNLFLQAIKGKDNKKVKAIVLGATPETRDMVLRHNCQLSTIDISLDAILKFGSIMKYRNNNREIIVKGDWLESPLQDHAYDVVIGDGVFNNVRVEDWPLFARQIRRQLKPSGFLILRENFIIPNRQRRPVEHYDQEFRQGKIHWFDLIFDLYFYSDLTSKACDFQKKRCYMTRFCNLLKKCYEQGRISKKSFDQMWWFRGNIVHSFIGYELFLKIMRRYFKLISQPEVNDQFRFTKSYFFFLFKPRR